MCCPSDHLLFLFSLMYVFCVLPLFSYVSAAALLKARDRAFGGFWGGKGGDLPPFLEAKSSTDGRQKCTML